MAKGALGVRHRVEGIGEGSLVGTLSRLLQLTCEAVVVFDGMGRVLLANDEALALFGAGGSLAGTDVRSLFPLPDEDGPLDVFSTDDLPFAVDGSTGVCSCAGADGRLARVRVRCDTVQAPGETYLLVARPSEAAELAGREQERAIIDLRRANRRLSGALGIVLDTLDSDDVATLFERVLEEITETMEADGTLVYLAESDGFHLRGLSSGLSGERIVRFMGFDRAMERLVFKEGRSVRLRVCAPMGDDLRHGRLTTRELVNEETREVLRIKSSLVPPFTSFIVVPVWFGGHIISLIQVGWRRLRPLLKEDAQLLDSVAHYLSVQLAGAFTALRSQRSKRLGALAADLREELIGSAPVFAGGEGEAMERMRDFLRDVAAPLDSAFVGVAPGATRGLCVADLPLTGLQELPVDLDELVGAAPDGGADAVGVLPGSPLSAALQALGEPCVGALLDLGELGGRRRCALFLRPDGAEPFDDLELDFLRQVGSDMRAMALGEVAREQDKRISQALQRGMRNELQDVEGITAQGVYSSATAAAFVGGDFYDLIRLPDRHACVIMGDVSGKGVEAASVSAAVKTALGAYAWEGLSPARMVRLLNEFLLGFSRMETFATLFVGIVDLSAATITYCSAGHPPALLLGPGADQGTMLDVQSGVVGAFHDIAYQDGVARLSEGDVLLLYTDGTTEARSPSGAFLGEQGLRDAVMRESGGDKPFEGFLDRLLAALDAFTGRNLDDDVAMVALRFDELGRDAPTKTGTAR